MLLQGRADAEHALDEAATDGIVGTKADVAPESRWSVQIDGPCTICGPVGLIAADSGGGARFIAGPHGERVSVGRQGDGIPEDVVAAEARVWVGVGGLDVGPLRPGDTARTNT